MKRVRLGLRPQRGFVSTLIQRLRNKFLELIVLKYPQKSIPYFKYKANSNELN